MLPALREPFILNLKYCASGVHFSKTALKDKNGYHLRDSQQLSSVAS